MYDTCHVLLYYVYTYIYIYIYILCVCVSVCVCVEMKGLGDHILSPFEYHYIVTILAQSCLPFHFGLIKFDMCLLHIDGQTSLRTTTTVLHRSKGFKGNSFKTTVVRKHLSNILKITWRSTSFNVTCWGICVVSSEKHRTHHWIIIQVRGKCWTWKLQKHNGDPVLQHYSPKKEQFPKTTTILRVYHGIPFRNPTWKIQKPTVSRWFSYENLPFTSGISERPPRVWLLVVWLLVRISYIPS